MHDEPLVALGLLVASAFSDMADGGGRAATTRPRPTGVVVDPITDKIFVLTVAVTLVVAGDSAARGGAPVDARISANCLSSWLSLDRAARKWRKEEHM